jgi:propionyl-CoA synthetase
MGFVIPKDASDLHGPASILRFEGEIMKLVDSQLGAVARPSQIFVVSALPKTRSGKLLRRALQAVCEKRDPGDLTTMEDPGVLEQVKQQVG